jgi:hypothetical protein
VNRCKDIHEATARSIQHHKELSVFLKPTTLRVSHAFPHANNELLRRVDEQDAAE